MLVQNPEVRDRYEFPFHSECRHLTWIFYMGTYYSEYSDYRLFRYSAEFLFQIELTRKLMYGTWFAIFFFLFGYMLLKWPLCYLMMLLHHVHLKDSTELDQLISHLINKEDSEGVVLLGHSTGCQVGSGCVINWSGSEFYL